MPVWPQVGLRGSEAGAEDSEAAGNALQGGWAGDFRVRLVPVHPAGAFGRGREPLEFVGKGF